MILSFASAELASSSSNANRASAGHRRWLICALVFFATTINYMDRTVLGLLAPMLQTTIGWNEAQYGYIVTAFQVSYALGLLVMGPPPLDGPPELVVGFLGQAAGIAVCLWAVLRPRPRPIGSAAPALASS